jgi:precorrin-2 dehydrogenase/sirohydrochlorin ferrochelatase
MAVFPFFINLKGKRCVIIGGGNVAERKIKVLLGFEPELVVISPTVTENIKQLHSQGAITHITDSFRSEYLDQAFLVIAATSDNQLNEAIYREAINRQLPVNVVDDPAKCTFIFPAIIQRDELVIGISTSGIYPALAKKIREKIEQVIPVTDRNVLKVLKDCRDRAGREIPDSESRSVLLNQIAAVLVSGAVSTPEELQQLINDKFREFACENN